MPVNYRKLILLLICAFAYVQVVGQTVVPCNGSFGDPIPESENFGSGTNPGLKLPTEQTNLIYRTSCQIEDGEYAILNRVTGCHPEGWHTVLKDHTGNTNGYMMVINAKEDVNVPPTFYNRKVGNLCPNTTYSFSAYVLNLIRKDVDGPGAKHPDLIFAIKLPDGTVFSKATGKIEPTVGPDFNIYPKADDPLIFTTDATTTEIELSITNNGPGGNGNDLIIDDITFRACGPTIEAKFSSSPNTIETLCEGESKTYQLNANVADPDYHTYQWQVNKNDGAGWLDIDPAGNPGATTSDLDITFTNAVVGTYQYRVAVAKNGNIAALNCRVYGTPLTVNVQPPPVAAASDPAPVCPGQPVNIITTGGVSYEWTTPDGSQHSGSTIQIPSATAADAGIYTITARSAIGCLSAPVTATVTVNPEVNASIDAIAASYCEGDPAQLTAHGGTGYLWIPATGLSNPNIANPIATPTETTTYRVVVNNGTCDDFAEVTLTVLKKPKANVPGPKTIFEGESVVLDAAPTGDNISYSWSPATGLDNPLSPTPVASPTADITYTLTVRSSICGTDIQTVFVRVYKKIIVPNTFTPNGDGANDIWLIKDLDTYPESILTIFNRNGQQLYRSIGYARPWDGTYGGSALPTGTYYYVIDLRNNTPKRTGFVMLLK